MNGIEISEDLFPIIMQTMHGEISDADLDEMFAWYDRYAEEQRKRYAAIIHATPGHESLNATQRKRVSEWQHQRQLRAS